MWMLFKSRQIPIKDAIFWPTWVHSELSTVGPSTGLKFRAHLGAAVLGSPLCGLSTLSRAPQWSHVHTLGAALWWGKLCICVLAFRPHVNSVLDHWKKKNSFQLRFCVYRDFILQHERCAAPVNIRLYHFIVCRLLIGQYFCLVRVILPPVSLTCP